MTIDETRTQLEKCLEELEPLTNFSHDNQYVGLLIADRMNHLKVAILTYRKLIEHHEKIDIKY